MKISIKSFKVPELFIDIPTTAAVGSLKVCDLGSRHWIQKNKEMSESKRIIQKNKENIILFFFWVFEILIQKNKEMSLSKMWCGFRR